MIFKKRLQIALPYIILSLIGIMFFVPLLWMVFASFDVNATLSVEWPENFTFENYSQLFTDPEIWRAFAIGVFLSLGSSLVIVLVSALAAYALSRFHIKHKNSIILTILFMSGL